LAWNVEFVARLPGRASPLSIVDSHDGETLLAESFGERLQTAGFHRPETVGHHDGRMWSGRRRFVNPGIDFVAGGGRNPHCRPTIVVLWGGHRVRVLAVLRMWVELPGCQSGGIKVHR
jgi:hypothetical protein